MQVALTEERKQRFSIDSRSSGDKNASIFQKFRNPYSKRTLDDWFEIIISFLSLHSLPGQSAVMSVLLRPLMTHARLSRPQGSLLPTLGNAKDP